MCGVKINFLVPVDSWTHDEQCPNFGEIMDDLSEKCGDIVVHRYFIDFDGDDEFVRIMAPKDLLLRHLRQLSAGYKRCPLCEKEDCWQITLAMLAKVMKTVEKEPSPFVDMVWHITYI